MLPALVLLALPSIGARPASATPPVPKKVLFFQGNLTSWVAAAGVEEVAQRFKAADIVAISHAGAHTYGSGWPNSAYGAQGCISLDHRAAMLSVLNRVRQLDAANGIRTLIFGYVAGTADAPDQGSKQALCGNNVNNFETPVYHTDTMTDFTACPGLGCLNTVAWVNEWVDGRDSLYWYMDGIFFDYVNSEKMTPTIRDNIYSFVKTKVNPITGATLKIMANSTVPGSPCGGGCASYGEVPNYQFAADSNYMTANDYVLVEGYYAGGLTGHCTSGGTQQYLWYPNWCSNRSGTATLRVADTNAIAGIRNTVASWHDSVKVHVAALVTEPPDAAFSALSCTWSDYTSAKTIFDGSSIAGDGMGYQFSDLGTIDDPADGLPDRDVRACP
jgi:hypothetical protein